MRVIRLGDEGEDVRDVQARLSALGHRIEPDEAGRFGPSTEAAVRAFQQARGLVVDGIVGAGTWTELVDAGYGLGDRTLYLHFPYLHGDDVGELQRRLDALGFDPGPPRRDLRRPDRAGAAGVPAQRGAAGGRHRRRHHHPGVRPAEDGGVEGPGRASVREGESVSRLETSLLGRAGRRSTPATGRRSRAASGPSGLTEAEATLRSRASWSASSPGAAPSRCSCGRTPAPTPRSATGPQVANRRGRRGRAVDPPEHARRARGAEGASTYYFGRAELRLAHRPAAGRADPGGADLADGPDRRPVPPQGVPDAPGDPDAGGPDRAVLHHQPRGRRPSCARRRSARTSPSPWPRPWSGSSARPATWRPRIPRAGAPRPDPGRGRPRGATPTPAPSPARARRRCGAPGA